MLPTVRLIDGLLGVFRRALHARLVTRLDRVFALVGGYGIYVLILVVLVSTLILAVRANAFEVFVLGLVYVPVGLVGQYVSAKMLASVDRLITSTRTDLTSSGFLDVVAVFALLAALLAPLGGLYAAIQTGLFQPFLGGLLACVLLLYTAAVALNPVLVNVHVSGDASVGQEAIGILTFALKGVYRFTPIAFGGLVVMAVVLCLVALGMGLSGDPYAAYVMGQAQTACLAAVVLPFVAYVAFLLLFVTIDLYRAILSIAQVAEGYRRHGPRD